MRTLLLLIACGCGSSKTTDPTPPSEPPPLAASLKDASCEEVADHSRELLQSGNDEKLRQRAIQIRKIIVTHCTADGWSMELRRCLAGARTVDDTDACEGLATEAQEEALEEETEHLEDAD